MNHYPDARHPPEAVDGASNGARAAHDALDDLLSVGRYGKITGELILRVRMANGYVQPTGLRHCVDGVIGKI